MTTFFVTTAADERAETNDFISENRDGEGLSLREAVALANANNEPDRIVFDDARLPPNARIGLNFGAIAITETLAIDGGGVTPGIDGNGASRIFEVSAPGGQPINVSLDTLRLTDGNAILGVGGAISAGENTALRITNSEIADSTASGGGGIFSSGSLLLGNVTIIDNQALSGNGGGILVNGFGGALEMYNSTVTGNTSIGDGGGIAFQDGQNATITLSTIAGNAASSEGGGISYSSNITLNQSIVANNSAFRGDDVAEEFRFATATVTASFIGSDIEEQTGLVDITLSQNDAGDPELSQPQTAGGVGRVLVPLEGSPVINAGGANPFVDDPFDVDNDGVTLELGVDQAFNPRLQDGAIDIGAIETSPPPVLNLVPQSLDVREGEDIVFTVERVGDTRERLEVQYLFSNLASNLTTFNQQDLTDPIRDTIVIEAGETAPAEPIRIGTATGAIESPEDFQLDLVSVAGAPFEIGQGRATGSLIGTPLVSLDAVSAMTTEGEAIAVTISSNGDGDVADPQDFTVFFEITPDSEVSPEDFAIQSPVRGVPLTGGSVEPVTVQIVPIPDGLIEGTESFRIRLIEDPNYAIANPDGQTGIVLDADAAPVGGDVIGEVRRISLTDQPSIITLDNTFTNPVVIAQAPGQNGGQPVTVRIDSAAGNRVVARLQEPNFLDGAHIAEEVTLLVVEAGTHRLADGTRLEAGTLRSNLLSSQGFEQVGFQTEFDTAPVVFSQVQTGVGADFVVTRQRSTDADGFQVTMQEEEANNFGPGAGHATETLGWLAIEGGRGSWSGLPIEAGTTAQNIGISPTRADFSQPFAAEPNLVTGFAGFVGADPAMMRMPSVDARGFAVRTQEEQSFDAELNHVNEAANYLAIGGEGLLTTGASQPMGGASPIGEVRSVSLSTVPLQITLDASFDAPVVFASVLSQAGADPVTVRFDSISSNQVTLRLQEPDTLDGTHTFETVSLFVVEAGRHRLADGSILEVGTVPVGGTTGSSGFVEARFETPGLADPTVLTQVQTVNGPSFVDTRQRPVQDGVQIALEEEEINNRSGHNTEQVGYLAIAQGVGTVAGSADSFLFEAGSTGLAVSDRGFRESFDAAFTEAPVLLHSLASFAGADPAVVRAQDLDAAGVRLTVQEDQSRDPERTHTAEDVDYLAFASDGLIFGDTL